VNCITKKTAGGKRHGPAFFLLKDGMFSKCASVLKPQPHKDVMEPRGFPAYVGRESNARSDACPRFGKWRPG
jgi:hypothetical protein